MKKKPRTNNQKMTCNNCGGQMFRSIKTFAETYCPACLMVHDWSRVADVPAKPKKVDK